MAGFLAVGFVANLMVRPVAQKYWLVEQPVKQQPAEFSERGAA
jgi:hypothetical protein